MNHTLVRVAALAWSLLVIGGWSAALLVAA